MSTPAIIGLLAAALQALTLFVLQGIREEQREMRREMGHLLRRVSEHEGFFAALKVKEKIGG